MRTVVAMYDRFEDAQRAVQALNEHGFNRDDINLIANDEQGEYSRYLEGGQTDQVESSGGEGAATGAGIGAVLGGLGGLLVGLGALAIPGIGPVVAAGPIVSALAGAGVGAVAGGLIGALVDLGIPEEHANYYAEGIRRGGTLVTLRTEDHMAEDARMVLNRFNPVDIDTRAREWQSQGWEGFRADETGAYAGTTAAGAIPHTGHDLTDDEMRNRDMYNQGVSDVDTGDAGHHGMTDRDRGMMDRDVTDRDVTGRDRTYDSNMPNDEVDPDAFRGVGTDLNTTENVGGSRIGENYPRGQFSDDMEPDLSQREPTEFDRDLGDRIPGQSDYDRTTVSGVNTGIPVTGQDDFEDRPLNSDEVTRMDDHLRDDVFGRDRPGTGETDIPVTGGTTGMVDNRMSGYSNLETDTDWSEFDQSFRSDYQTRYAMSGQDYEYYSPAYRYGYDLAHDETYRSYDWERLEPEARRDWESRGLEGAWEDVKDAVRHAWDSIRR